MPNETNEMRVADSARGLSTWRISLTFPFCPSLSLRLSFFSLILSSTFLLSLVLPVQFAMARFGFLSLALCSLQALIGSGLAAVCA